MARRWQPGDDVVIGVHSGAPAGAYRAHQAPAPLVALVVRALVGILVPVLGALVIAAALGALLYGLVLFGLSLAPNAPSTAPAATTGAVPIT